jgi:PD-(D/E)XK nuclease superfamily protein
VTTNQKGAIAETAIAHAATKLGIEVYQPVAEGGRYDMIFVTDNEMLRVHCKWATRRGDVLIVPCVSSRRSRDGFVRRRYTAAEIDAIAAYSIDLDCCYFVPIERVEGRPAIALRLAPARNNQRRRINWAEEYALVARLGRHGAVAQLGERRDGIA